LNGDNEAAIPVLERAVDDGPESYTPRLWLACALVELGRLDEAGLISKIVLNIEPNFSAAGWAESFKSETHARLKDNMLAAGFPNRRPMVIIPMTVQGRVEPLISDFLTTALEKSLPKIGG